jgi:hypothetical protein|mmetsp:Transcript_20896/g.3380  ORF Transcript_20896/g.3380 Transcript_20896/m.3380 type:complete len:93 (+) Transcript_20896:1067-1345(+)
MILIWIIGALLPNILMKHISHDVGKKFTMNFTSVPGPTNKIYFKGKLLKEMHPAGPTVGNTASVMAMASNEGFMNITLTADKGVIKEPEKLV